MACGAASFASALNRPERAACRSPRLPDMKRILLYSPDLVGHPSVYCRVIADALATEPCQLVVAAGFTDKIGLNESPDIQPLSSRAGVQLIDTRTYSRTGKPHLTAEELVGLQQYFSTDTTLLIEADK